MAGKYAIETVFSLIDKVSAPTSKVGKALDNLGIKSKTVSNALKRDFDKASERVDKLGKTITKATGMLAAAGVAAAGAFIAKGTKDAIEFQTALAKINTVADTTIMPLEKISSGVLDLSNKLGVSSNDIADSFYQVVFAGVSTDKALSVVEAATKLSKVAFIDMGSAINSTATILNAYGKSADEADKITNQMYLATTLGNAEFSEMEKSMKRVIPQAAALGVGTEEVFASISVLTGMGEKTGATMKALGGAMGKIIKPSKQASEAAEKLGLDFSASALQQKGFKGFLDDVVQKTGGNVRSLEALFGDIDMARMIGKLTTTGADAFDKTMTEMTSTDAVGAAFDKLMDTPQQRFANAMNNIRNSGIKLGTAILPVVEMVIGKISEIADRLSQVDFSKYTGAFEKAFSVLNSFVSGLFTVINAVWQFRGVIIAVAVPILAYQAALMGAVMAAGAYTKIMAIKKNITLAATAVQKGYALIVAKVKAAQDIATASTLKATAAQAGEKIAAGLSAQVLAIKATALGVLNKLQNINVKASLKSAAAFTGQAIAAGAATIAQWALNAAMSANPIGLIIIGVVALIAAVVLLIKNWKKITEAIKNNANKILGILMILCLPLGIIISLIKEIVSNWGKIKEALSGAGILDKIKEIGAGIINFIQPAIDWFVNIWTVVSNAVAGFFNFFVNGITSFFAPAINWIINAWHTATSAIGAFFKGIFDAVYNFVRPALDFFSEKWEQIVSFFQNNAIVNAIKTIGGIVISGLLAPVQGLLELLSKIPGVGKLAEGGAKKLEELRNSLKGEDVKVSAAVDMPQTVKAELTPPTNTKTAAVALPAYQADYAMPDLSSTATTTGTGGKSKLHGVVDVSGGATASPLGGGPTSTSSSAAGNTTTNAVPAVLEVISRNVSGITTVLRSIEAIINNKQIDFPRINMNGDDRRAGEQENPRNIAPITQAERTTYNMEERINRLVIEVAAEKGSAARIVRAPEDAKIELVNSGGNV